MAGAEGAAVGAFQCGVKLIFLPAWPCRLMAPTGAVDLKGLDDVQAASQHQLCSCAFTPDRFWVLGISRFKQLLTKYHRLRTCRLPVKWPALGSGHATVLAPLWTTGQVPAKLEVHAMAL